MCISTNGQLRVAFNLHFNHGWFIIYNPLYSHNNLINIFLVYLLAILETFQHISDEFGRHFVAQLYTIVILDNHIIEVKAFCCRRRISNFDSSKELNPLNNLLAFCQSEFRIFVARYLLNYGLEISEGFFGFEDCSVCNSSTIVCLRVSC